MKGDERRCGCREEDLLLHLYGESDDPGLAAHVAGCEECRRWLAQAGQVRELASTCVDDAGDDVVRAVLDRSREAHRLPAAAASRRRPRLGGWLNPAMAAAAVVLTMVALNFRERGRQNAPGAGEVPDYVSGLDGELNELEQGLAREERVLADEVDALAALKVIDEQDLAEIEVSLTEVESGFGIRLDDETLERSGR